MSGSGSGSGSGRGRESGSESESGICTRHDERERVYLLHTAEHMCILEVAALRVAYLVGVHEL